LPRFGRAGDLKYAFIAAHRHEFPIKRMCEVLCVWESGYYAWCKREPSQRRREDEAFFEYIQIFYNQQRKYSPLGYVSPIIYEQMKGAANS
jgi:hypothetical protein